MHHFDGIRPDFYVRPEMAGARSHTRKTDNPASVALVGIARLLARQAARDWAERRPSVPSVIIEYLLRWDALVEIEVINDDEVAFQVRPQGERWLGKPPKKFFVMRHNGCRFQFRSYENGHVLQIDFSHLSSEYSYYPDRYSSGYNIIFKGVGDGPVYCETTVPLSEIGQPEIVPKNGACYRDMKIGVGGVESLTQIVRAVEFIGAESCPLGRKPF